MRLPMKFNGKWSDLFCMSQKLGILFDYLGLGGTLLRLFIEQIDATES